MLLTSASEVWNWSSSISISGVVQSVEHVFVLLLERTLDLEDWSMEEGVTVVLGLRGGGTLTCRGRIMFPEKCNLPDDGGRSFTCCVVVARSVSERLCNGFTAVRHMGRGSGLAELGFVKRCLRSLLFH